jgi:DNA polymerase-3 subunit beta
MKFTIHRDDFRSAIQSMSGVVANKVVIPILSHILIVSHDGEIECKATDLETAVTVKRTAKIITAGSVTIPAKLLADVLNNLPSSEVAVTVTNGNTTITCGNTECQINGSDVSDYPDLPIIEGVPFTFASQPFRVALAQVVIATAADDSRPVLTAVRLSVANNQMTLCAADGFRLAKAIIPIETEATWEILVPSKTVTQLIKILPTDGNVQILQNSNLVQFTMTGSTITSRLIDGKYPDIERVIPTEYGNRLVIDVADANRALKVASLLGSMIRITIAETHVTIRAKDDSRGNNQTEVPVLSDGTPHDFAVNVQFLQEAIAACGGTQVIWETKSSASPVIVKPMNNSNYLHVVMPMATR